MADSRETVLDKEAMLALIALSTTWGLNTNVVTGCFELKVMDGEETKTYIGPNWREWSDEEYTDFAARMDKLADHTTRVNEAN